MCKWGTDTDVELAFPQAISGRTTVKVDSCLAVVIQALNAVGIHTVACCCGHGKGLGRIDIEQNGRLVTLDLLAGKRSTMPTSDANLTCPMCGSDLDVEEVDIGVGTLRHVTGCSRCHWTPPVEA